MSTPTPGCNRRARGPGRGRKHVTLWAANLVARLLYLAGHSTIDFSVFL
jgi:hypothetical protein